MERLSISSAPLWLKRRLTCWKRHSVKLAVNVLILSECGPNPGRYACTQRFRRRRYMRPPHAASTTRGNSRQTDFKGAPLQRIAHPCRAVFRCLSPASNGSRVPKKPMTHVLFAAQTGCITFALFIIGSRYRPPSARPRQPHQACDKASIGRFSVDARPRTSVRGNVRSQSG